jgi:hypothetical protein
MSAEAEIETEGDGGGGETRVQRSTIMELSPVRER